MFDKTGLSGYGPVATYRQPRRGDVDDEHGASGVRPARGGVAEVQALAETPRLTLGHRGQAGRDFDASNGAQR